MILKKFDLITVFMRFIGHKNFAVREQVIWGLGNICDDSEEYRNEIL
jgi:hypothetical protein